MNEQHNVSNSRLSKIETLWSVVRRAHENENGISTTAQQQLLEIYGGAIRSYLIGSLRNEDLAEDLFQEFALKFVNGDFKQVDPARGRFRGFVKTVLSRMVAGHFRKKSTRKEQELVDDHPKTEPSLLTLEDDEKFLVSWRDDLLEQTWQQLADHEAKTGAPYYSILSLRAAEPTLNSEEQAQRLSKLMGKEIAPGAARVTLHRSRDKFARIMIEIVSCSLVDPTPENIESELIDLRLIEYCRKVLNELNSDQP